MLGLRLQTLLQMLWKGKGEINFFYIIFSMMCDLRNICPPPPSPLRKFIFALNIYSGLLISKPPFPSPPPPPKEGISCDPWQGSYRAVVSLKLCNVSLICFN